MRSDIFALNKSVHIKLNKDLYIALRKISIERGLTVQEMFAEFAKLVVEGNLSATRMLDNYAIKKIKAQIEERPRGKSKEVNRSTLDTDALYALINDDSESE